MPRGPEEQDGLLAGGRGAGEVRDGHGCGGEGLVNLGWEPEVPDFLSRASLSSQSLSLSIFKLAFETRASLLLSIQG